MIIIHILSLNVQYLLLNIHISLHDEINNLKQKSKKIGFFTSLFIKKIEFIWILNISCFALEH